MKQLTILGIFALVMLLVLPGAVSAADVQVSGSVVDEDLTVTAISPNVGVGAAFFANEPNVISVTVTNNGGLDAAASTVSVDVAGSVYTASIGALAAGASETVTVTDTVSHTYAGGPVTVTATADSDDIIGESDETNNAMASDLTVYNNGYKGKRYTPELGGDMTTQATFDGQYNVIYSAGNTVYKGHPWTEEIFSWTTADLPIPAGATVVNARLYQAYTYNQMGVDPAFTMSFNGATVTPVATYMDIKGFGSYSFPYGLYVYDVTSGFDTAGNSMTITPEAGENYGIYGAYLIVTYSDPATTEKKIYINDEFDMVYSKVSYSVNDEEATAYATFADVDTTDLASAQAIAILAAADKTDMSRFLFNGEEYTGFWSDYLSSPQLGFSVYDVTSDLSSGANEAGLQSVAVSGTGDNMYAMNTILVVNTGTVSAPVVDFTADPTSGVDPLTVAFDATNTGGAVDSWKWEYSADSGTTWTEFATTEDASFTFGEGTYSVRVTATGPDYTDAETKDNLIQVGEAVIQVTIDPASIDFGTMQAGVDETGSTGVSVDVTGGTAWSVDASATNGGYMGTGTVNLANPFQLSNGGSFQDMTTNFADFLTGTAGVDGSGTADVKQSIDASDAPGAYSITLTFTGGFV